MTKIKHKQSKINNNAENVDYITDLTRNNSTTEPNGQGPKTMQKLLVISWVPVKRQLLFNAAVHGLIETRTYTVKHRAGLNV